MPKNTEKTSQSEKVNLKIVMEAAQIINSTLKIDEVLECVMDKVIQILGAERGFIMLIDEDTKELVLKTARNMDKQTIDSEDFSASFSSIESVAKGGPPIFCANTQLDPKLSKRASIALHSIRWILCFPLKVKEAIIGVIYVDNRITSSGYFDEEDRDLMEVLSNQAAIAIENARLYENLEKSYLDVIRALANAIEAKNPYTKGHSDRVTILAVKIGEAMNFSLPQLKEIEMAGILHDVGKLGIGEEVLEKPGRLTEEEFREMKMHPGIGHDIIKTITLPENVKKAVLHHQEKFDGTGYPQGLKGEEIPIYARIIAVCDSYDAMTSDRVYRKSMGKDFAISEIKRCSGTQFDPEVVEVFLNNKIYDIPWFEVNEEIVNKLKDKIPYDKLKNLINKKFPEKEIFIYELEKLKFSEEEIEIMLNYAYDSQKNLLK
ncbi:MAG TPA: HD domain-containing phosphohydrolase [Candidatus Eremiobacteraeota bacterium]|nr:HD domain-containing phosphohydrolase [Candidatus Eremiobacteraeota bacterium]